MHPQKRALRGVRRESATLGVDVRHFDVGRCANKRFIGPNDAKTSLNFVTNYLLTQFETVRVRTTSQHRIVYLDHALLNFTNMTMAMTCDGGQLCS